VLIFPPRRFFSTFPTHTSTTATLPISSVFFFLLIRHADAAVTSQTTTTTTATSGVEEE